MQGTALVDVRRSFGDLLVGHDLGASDFPAMVAAATDLLVHGVDADPVVALAAKDVTSLTSPVELDALVANAREALGMPPLAPEDAAIRATQSCLRQWRHGAITDRTLATWLLQGSDSGLDIPADLVSLAATLFDLDYFGETAERVQRRLEGAAEAVLRLTDPWS